MLSAVLGLFSQDLAVDIGTSTTRIYQRGFGVVCDEPTVVAVHTDRRGRRKVLSVGLEAQPMVGRTPTDVEAVRPVRDAQIHDYEVTEALLLHLVRRIHGRNGWVSPKMVVAIPAGATDMERRAVRESCETAGARQVYLIPRPLAGAIGADLPVDRPSGHLLVDIGGGATEISVLSLSGVVSSQVVAGGGEGVDRALMELLRIDHSLMVGPRSAEVLKLALASAIAPLKEQTRFVRGRCLKRGIPRQVQVTAAEVHEAVRPRVDEIARAIRKVLERTPPELASDVVDHGVVLTGAGSLLRGLDVALRNATGLPVVHAERPDGATIRGTGRVLEELDLLKAMAC